MFSQVAVGLHQDRDVHRLIGHHAFEALVLDLEFLEASGLLGFHAAVLALPSRERRLADVRRLDDLGDGSARREHGVGLPQLVDDLFGCMSVSLHRESPGRHRRPPGLP